MDKRSVIKALAAAPLALGLHKAGAQGTPFKIGFLAPMTGPFASTGKQMEAAARLFMKRASSWMSPATKMSSAGPNRLPRARRHSAGGWSTA